MILVDTSVWVDHLRTADRELIGLLEAGKVLTHPFVIGEIALGNLARRRQVLGALTDMPQAQLATNDESLHFIEQLSLSGLGIGYVDVHLLASVRLTAGSRLLTRDRKLQAVAERLGLAADT